MPAISETNAGGLSATFAALSDPTRRVILERLRRGDATPGELARPLRISWPAVTKHLRVLERAGLLQRRRHGRHHVLTLEPGPIQRADAWIAHRQFWEGSLDALANYWNAASAERWLDGFRAHRGRKSGEHARKPLIFPNSQAICMSEQSNEMDCPGIFSWNELMTRRRRARSFIRHSSDGHARRWT
jgi:DNA-binding transcriptional ArsR family regulator